MVIDFSTFTRYFFYLFVSYQCAKYNYPEKTKICLIFIGYNAIYLYSKLQILINKQIIEGHNTLIKYEKYRNLIDHLYKIKVNYDVLKERVLFYITREPRQTHKLNEVTLDFVLNNEVIFTFEKSEFLNDYLADFFPNENESKRDDIIDYDFVIINCDENLKKIVKHVDLIKSDFETETCSIFKSEPFLFKPLLCEFSNQPDENDENDSKPIKIDFCDNNKFYDFLVVGNCFDKDFLTYFMKRYYDIDIKENYVLKIIDNNVNTLIIESTDTLTIEENNLVVNYKNK
jgi:hypothetical protein